MWSIVLWREGASAYGVATPYAFMADCASPNLALYRDSLALPESGVGRGARETVSGESRAALRLRLQAHVRGMYARLAGCCPSRLVSRLDGTPVSSVLSTRQCVSRELVSRLDC